MRSRPIVGVAAALLTLAATVTALPGHAISGAATSSAIRGPFPPSPQPLLFNVTMTSSPDPSTAGQIVRFAIDFGPYCLDGGGRIKIYAALGTGVDPIRTQELGFLWVPVQPQRVSYLYSSALGAGTWRVNGDGSCLVQASGPYAEVHAIEMLQTVRPKPAAPPATRPAAPAVHATAHVPTIAVPVIDLHPGRVAPQLVEMRPLARVEDPAEPPPAPVGTIAAVVALAAVVAALGAVRRWRILQHR